MTRGVVLTWVGSIIYTSGVDQWVGVGVAEKNTFQDWTVRYKLILRTNVAGIIDILAIFLIPGKTFFM